MRLIQPSYEILEQAPGIEGIYEAIERAGRTCYKSTRPEGKTAKDFVDMLINRKHYAMLEFGTVYLKIPINSYSVGAYYHRGTILASQFEVNPYSVVNYKNDTAYVTTNFRVLIESFKDNMDDILNKYLCEPTEHHEKRVAVRFITSIGIGREFLRHRKFSFANESSRYCDYSSEKKFQGQVTYIIPYWFRTPAKIIEEYTESSINNELFTESEESFYRLLARSEWFYKYVLGTGCKPQEAREVLPLATKSELVMTGFISDWEHLFRLRTSIFAETGKPHPDMAKLCDPLYNDFIKNKWLR